MSVGGVVAEIVRDLLKRTKFAGGGVVVAEIVRDLHKRTTFAGGGVVGEMSVLS